MTTVKKHTSDNIKARDVAAAGSWRVVRLAAGEKFTVGVWAMSRVMFVLRGAVEVVSGFKREQRIEGRGMALVHAVRSRTLQATEASLVLVCLLERESCVRDSAARDAEAVIEAMRRVGERCAAAGAMPFGDEVGQLLAQVVCFVDTRTITARSKFDDFLRMCLARMLHETVAFSVPGISLQGVFGFGGAAGSHPEASAARGEASVGAESGTSCAMSCVFCPVGCGGCPEGRLTFLVPKTRQRSL